MVDPKLKLTKDEDDSFDDGAALSRFNHGLCVARQLHALGEAKQAKLLLDFLQQLADEAEAKDRVRVLTAKCQLGYREEGIAAAADLLDEQNEHIWFRALYGNQQRAAAQAIWAAVRKKHPQESKQDSLQRLERWLGTAARENVTREEWAAIVLSTCEASVGASVREYKLKSLAQICRERGDTDLELHLLEEIAGAADHHYQTAAGEFHIHHEKWEQAARWFENVCQRNPQNVTALYLHGYSRSRLGEQEAGERMMKLAELLPLANGEARYGLATALERVNLLVAARRQWQLIVRTEAFDAQHNAAAHLGNLLVGNDPLRAAELWQLMMLSTIGVGHFADATSYLELPYVVHKTRGRGLLAEGEVEAAKREFDLALSASPGEIQLAIDVVPLLERAGHKDDAERLFARVYQANEQVCVDFPNSAHHHNRTAWLAARCGRRLDEALKHGQHAVELAPHNPDYLDTLAEVYSAQGKHQQAIEVMQRCVEMVPKQKIFQARLEQLQKTAKNGKR